MFFIIVPNNKKTLLLMAVTSECHITIGFTVVGTMCMCGAPIVEGGGVTIAS